MRGLEETTVSSPGAVEGSFCTKIISGLLATYSACTKRDIVLSWFVLFSLYLLLSSYLPKNIIIVDRGGHEDRRYATASQRQIQDQAQVQMLRTLQGNCSAVFV